jgi:hypothetical protein
MSDAPRLRTLSGIIYEQTEVQWAVDNRIFGSNVQLVPIDGADQGKHKLGNGINTYAELGFVEDGAAPITTERVWAGYLTQTGTDAPTINELTNTLGGDPVFSYDSGGSYTATLAGAFGRNVTSMFAGSASFDPVGSLIANGSVMEIRSLSDDTITIQSGYTGSGLLQNDLITDAWFRITVTD